MVRLAEWRGKEIFRRYGIPVPRGRVVRSVDEAEAALSSSELPLPCVAKAQVVAGGRGKGGAVRFAADRAEVLEATRALLALTFQGERVREVLLEEKLAPERELYLSITLDRSRRVPVLMASAEGGIEIESVPPERIETLSIHPFAGLVGYEKRRVTIGLGVSGVAAKALNQILEQLWKIFEAEDAELVEVNPLAVVGDGLVALDAKVVVEDDAGFRHPEYADIRGELTPLEELAREKGIAFVQLGGDIGVIANGAGLTMATLDVLAESGGRPGIFLDLGGTDDPAKVTEAFLLMAEARPRAVFLNIFGGVTRCDTVARGLIEAMKQVPNEERFPLVARIRGLNEKEGVALLMAAGIPSLPGLREAVVATVEAARRVPAPKVRGAAA